MIKFVAQFEFGYDIDEIERIDRLQQFVMFACLQLPQIIRPPIAPYHDSRLTYRVGLDIRPGFVAQDNPFFKGEKEAGKPIRHALSTHLKYSFQFSKDSEIGLLYPHAYQGIGVSYHYLDNHQELGSPVSVYAFQGSRIARLSRTLSLDYEWNFGASFGWKKHDTFTNAYNGAVGSKINAYINVGFLLNWQLAPQWNPNRVDTHQAKQQVEGVLVRICHLQ